MKVKDLSPLLREKIKKVVCTMECIEGKNFKRGPITVKKFSISDKYTWTEAIFYFEGRQNYLTDEEWMVMLGPRGGIIQALYKCGRGDYNDETLYFRKEVNLGSIWKCNCISKVRNGEYDFIDDIEIEVVE